MSINQSITGTFICAQIKIIRFENTAQKNKAPGDGEMTIRSSSQPPPVTNHVA